MANGKVYASGQTFDASNGKFLWNWPVCPAGTTTADSGPQRNADIAVTSDIVYVPYTTRGFGLLLGAFDANTGQMRWSIGWSTINPDPSSPQPSAPVVTDNVLFSVAPNGGPGGNHIIADNASTGARLWDSPRDPSNNYGDPIVANSVVYAASTSGHLDAFHLPSG